jgi:uncharacterized coiled-coil protein SlyX
MSAALRAVGPGVAWERRLETLEARIEHLEGALEGLQDAVYRQAVLEDEKLDEVRRQIAPERMARELTGMLEGAGCDGGSPAQRASGAHPRRTRGDSFAGLGAVGP